MENNLKVLVATSKPFAAAAVEGIKEIFAKANIETIMLEKYNLQSELQAAAADVDGIIVRSDWITKDIVKAAPLLKIVVRAGAGYDNIDLEACSANDIVVMNTPGQNANAVAELTIGMMLYMARNSFSQSTGSELRGKKLGIHGYGNVGRRVAALGKAFGMQIVGCDAPSKLDNMFYDGAKPVASAADLYSQCDVVSIHIPANAETRKLVNAALLDSMPRNAILINTARKEVIDEEALFDVMQRRTDLRYATDVAPFIHDKIQNVLGIRYFATDKKIGAETEQANFNAGLAAARQMVNFFENGDTSFQVNR
jgi:D-3-phosphoglycerate dehydrogenase